MDDIETWKKRLIYRSWHRGTREMDLIMGNFAERHVPDMDAAMLESYEDLLNASDPDVYDWYIGTGKPPGDMNETLMKLFLSYQIEKSG